MSKFILSRGKDAAVGNLNLIFRVSAILAVAAAILRSVAYLTSFDVGIGYFNRSFFATAVNYLIIVSCAFALSGFVLISKDAKLPVSLDASGNAVYFTSVFAGFIMIADFVYKTFSVISEEKIEYYKFIFNSAYRIENAYIIRATAVIEILGVAASLLSGVYFFLRSSKRGNGKLCTWFGFFPLIRALVGVAHVYFEMEVQMNHPSKLMLQFALIAVMIYLLCEQRFYISEDHPRPRRFFVCGCIAFILAFSGGVSEMIGFLSGALSRGDFCVEAFFCLTFSFYIFSRTLSFVRAASEKTEPAAAAAAELSAEE